MKQTSREFTKGKFCVYCGCSHPLLLTVDHIVPKSKGGKDIDSNKQVCCYICNLFKGTLSDKEYKAYYKNMVALYGIGRIKLSIGNISLKLTGTDNLTPGKGIK